LGSGQEEVLKMALLAGNSAEICEICGKQLLKEILRSAKASL
jgi:hypothetical protein